MRNIDLENEKQFENRKASGEQVRAKQSKYYWATSLPAKKHREETYRFIEGAKVLEIGCASGGGAINYCKYAKSYIGVDISDVAIDACNALSIENAEFHCVDGHKLPAEDKSIEYVIVDAVLHHLDLETSFEEISRVLSDRGALIFNEPLGTNPAFQIYRMATPSARTEDERPFTFTDLRLMNKYFNLYERVQWFGFLSILSAFSRNENIRTLLTAIDGLLSKTPLRYFFWQFSGIANKR